MYLKSCPSPNIWPLLRYKGCTLYYLLTIQTNPWARVKNMHRISQFVTFAIVNKMPFFEIITTFRIGQLLSTHRSKCLLPMFWFYQNLTIASAHFTTSTLRMDCPIHEQSMWSLKTTPSFNCKDIQRYLSSDKIMSLKLTCQFCTLHTFNNKCRGKMVNLA